MNFFNDFVNIRLEARTKEFGPFYRDQKEMYQYEVSYSKGTKETKNIHTH